MIKKLTILLLVSCGSSESVHEKFDADVSHPDGSQDSEVNLNNPTNSPDVSLDSMGFSMDSSTPDLSPDATAFKSQDVTQDSGGNRDSQSFEAGQIYTTDGYNICWKPLVDPPSIWSDGHGCRSDYYIYSYGACYDGICCPGGCLITGTIQCAFPSHGATSPPCF